MRTCLVVCALRLLSQVSANESGHEGEANRGPLQQFLGKVCISDAECSASEQCQAPLSGALAGLGRPSLLGSLSMLSIKTCGPRSLPPGYTSTGVANEQARHFVMPDGLPSHGNEDETDERSSENVFNAAVAGVKSLVLGASGLPTNLLAGVDTPSSPQIECRAFQRQLFVGETITINATGPNNDLFNVTTGPNSSDDQMLVHIKELQTMAKVPGTFQFTCDTSGVFTLKFKVFVTDVGGGLLGRGVQLCKSIISCVPRTPLTSRTSANVDNLAAFAPFLEGLENGGETQVDLLKTPRHVIFPRAQKLDAISSLEVPNTANGVIVPTEVFAAHHQQVDDTDIMSNRLEAYFRRRDGTAVTPRNGISVGTPDAFAEPLLDEYNTDYFNPTEGRPYDRQPQGDTGGDEVNIINPYNADPVMFQLPNLDRDYITQDVPPTTTTTTTTSPPTTTTTTSATLQAPQKPPQISCHALEVDVKVQRPLALSLPSTLFTVIADSPVRTRVVIPEYEGDAQNFVYTCQEPGKVVKHAVILAEAASGAHDLRYCPLTIS